MSHYGVVKTGDTLAMVVIGIFMFNCCCVESLWLLVMLWKSICGASDVLVDLKGCSKRRSLN